MKVYFHKIKDKEEGGIVWYKNTICFVITHPIIVQPSEIMKTPLNTIIKIEDGHVLSLTTHPNLASRAGELFPASLVLDADSEERPLELAVKNNGRSPLNLMIDDRIAWGHVCVIAEIEPVPFVAKTTLPKSLEKSKPVKKNTNVKFEIK